MSFVNGVCSCSRPPKAWCRILLPWTPQPRSSLVSFQVDTLSLERQAPSDSVTVDEFSCVLRSHICESTQNAYFGSRLYFCDSIKVLCISSSPCLFIAKKHFMNILQFVYSSVDGHLCCFQLWAIINKAVMNTLVQDFLWTQIFISLRWISRG